MGDEVVIDGQVFWERLSKLHKAWHVRFCIPQPFFFLALRPGALLFLLCLHAACSVA